MTLCRYRNALGVPHEGVHRERIFYMARNDWLMTVIAAFLLTFCFFLPTRPKPFIIMFLVILTTLEGLAIILHRAFCVRTQIDIWLFN